MSPRELWIEALRSGKYKQGKSALCRSDKYCCLGVACEIYQKHVGDLVIREISNTKSFDGCIDHIPKKVQSWLKLKTCDGYSFETKLSLTLLNDYKKTFEQIAEILEKNDSYFVT